MNKLGLILGASILLVSGQVNADLIVRGQGTSAHGTYNLIYDDVQDITWYDYTHPNDFTIAWGLGFSRRRWEGLI